jgi:hypothetical protein
MQRCVLDVPDVATFEESQAMASLCQFIERYGKAIRGLSFKEETSLQSPTVNCLFKVNNIVVFSR